jgi:hypothetical protein
MKIHSIYDDGPDGNYDRYTVYYKGRGTVDRINGTRMCVGMSAAPFHPQGFGQHCYGKIGKHNGKRIMFDQLPKDCQRLVMRDLNS